MKLMCAAGYVIDQKEKPKANRRGVFVYEAWDELQIVADTKEDWELETDFDFAARDKSYRIPRGALEFLFEV